MARQVDHGFNYAAGVSEYAEGVASSSPGLRALALPWELAKQTAATPTGLWLLLSRDPRVARSAQPGAGGCNAFGVFSEITFDLGKKNLITNNRCPRCYEGRLKSWSELTDDEREVVKRLPASAQFTEKERRATHRWCTRCWFESTDKTAAA